MYSFMYDYSEGAHPKILDALYRLNEEQNIGYGEDIHCLAAKKSIKSLLLREDVDIHFIPGGTQTNLLVISSFLRPHECLQLFVSYVINMDCYYLWMVQD